MSDPWNLKTNYQRAADTLTTFIIFCEDEVSEPIYFKYFETSRIKVNCIPNQKSMMKNVINAIHHCQENDLLTHNKDEDCLIEGIQVWCVFDRDKEETKDKIDKGNIEFNESIEVAERKGMKVAWSNDVFELWVLMHFEEVSQKERADFYKRLTEIFKTLPAPNEHLNKIRLNQNFNYKESLKRRMRFCNIVRPELIRTSTTAKAIERAKKLDESFAKSTKPSEKAPCTKVYLLVEELLNYGQKFEIVS